MGLARHKLGGGIWVGVGVSGVDFIICERVPWWAKKRQGTIGRRALGMEIDLRSGLQTVCLSWRARSEAYSKPQTSASLSQKTETAPALS